MCSGVWFSNNSTNTTLLVGCRKEKEEEEKYKYKENKKKPKMHPLRGMAREE